MTVNYFSWPQQFSFLCIFALGFCSVLGGLLSVGSLYSVLWAKKREEEQKKAANVEAKHMPMEMQGGEEKAVV